MRLRGEQGLGIIDTLIVVVLISILIGVVIPKYQRMAQEAREAVLQVSLGNIRKGIQLYVLTKKEIPPDLQVLIREQVVIPMASGTIFSDTYLNSVTMDSEGYPLDPFGNRFGYLPATGQVFSTTKGYEKW